MGLISTIFGGIGGHPVSIFAFSHEGDQKVCVSLGLDFP